MSIGIKDIEALAATMANGGSECEWRSGASRGYYAMFHKVLQVADACLPPSNFVLGEHERLGERLKAQGLKGRSLAYRLQDMKKVRTRADYFLDEDFSQADATDLIANCPSIEAQADQFFAVVHQASNP
ncbi:hypothetical protein L0Z13_06860 [Burkholderia multivorans]|uniref:hypothetical protein n=1 Tax=Burkholderia multivorans TaxID=87883 RepID=UPI001121631B|nr:hypothetical protein [Burkholderia multivorans]MBU9495878.1 hypothetical protein [Burkholderia multivorans]MCO1436296.1 hypothetical protein [Burkholderia multivorans]MDN7508949.1 hypothetical protein [Burkholderia multivorans]UQN61370.1 hypothetical protein L0Y94_17060 [Burkholderia multivorans]UQN65319.1 hypothetical protein L0Y92_24295 [Burkholderia multivorans]